MSGKLPAHGVKHKSQSGCLLRFQPTPPRSFVLAVAAGVEQYERQNPNRGQKMPVQNSNAANSTSVNNIPSFSMSVWRK